MSEITVRRCVPADLPPHMTAKIVVDEAGCWVWQNATNGKGYGQVGFMGRVRSVHRVAYELLVGPIPDGLCIDHLCRVRACCNPYHLEPVTTLVNNRRGGLAARPTYIPKQLDEVNPDAMSALIEWLNSGLNLPAA